MEPVVRVQAEDFSPEAELDRMVAGRTDVGGLACFVGLCRDEGGRLAALELEHYPGMAEDEMRRVADETARRWPLLGLAAVHRFGRIAPGGRIVLVAAASAHRGPAFAAAEFMMDFLKTRAPFWKREHLRDGGAGPWVEATAADESAAERWGGAG